MKEIRTLATKYTFIWAPILLFIVAFSLRMIHLNSYRENPEYLAPDMDEGYHLQWAQKIEQGKMLPNEAFFRAPLYPYFLALLYKISGGNLHLIRIMQAILGALTVVLIYVLALRFFEWRYAFISGIVAAFSFYLVYFSTELLIPVILVPLHVIFLLVFLDACKRGKPALYLLAGALAGLCALARPNILLVVFALALFLVIKNKDIWKPLLFCFMCLLVILPVTVVNYIVSDDFVLIASQGGVNFYIGNNPKSDGLRAIVPDQSEDWWGGYFDAIEFAQKSEAKVLKPSEISAFYYKRAVLWIASNPIEAFVHELKKLYFFFHGFDLPNNKNIYFMKYFFGSSYIPFIQFSILSGFALLGLFLSFRKSKNRDEWIIVTIFAIVYTISIVIFFICARYRLSVFPVLLLYATLALRMLIEAKGRARLILVAILLGILCLTNIPVFERLYNFGTYAVLYGVKYRELGELDKADEFIRSARDYDHPEHIVENELGIVSYVRNDLEMAKGHFQRSLQAQNDFYRAKHNLALVYYDEKKIEEAFDLLETIDIVTVINDPAVFSLFFDLHFLLNKQEDFMAYLGLTVLEDKHYRELARKADELLDGQYYKNANLVYNYLYANKYKNPELMNNLGITEYHLDHKDKALFLFSLSGSDEARQNLEKLKELEGLSDEVQETDPT